MAATTGRSFWSVRQGLRERAKTFSVSKKWGPVSISLNPKPYTLNLNPWTLNPKTWTANPKPHEESYTCATGRAGGLHAEVIKI